MNRKLILGTLMMIIGGLSAVSILWYSFIYLDESELSFEFGIIVIVIVTGVSPFLITTGYTIQKKELQKFETVSKD